MKGEFVNKTALDRPGLNLDKSNQYFKSYKLLSPLNKLRNLYIRIVFIFFCIILYLKCYINF